MRNWTLRNLSIGMGPRPFLRLLARLTNNLVGVFIICFYFKLRRLELELRSELDNAKCERDSESGNEFNDVDGSVGEGQGSGAQALVGETGKNGDTLVVAASLHRQTDQPPAAGFEQKRPTHKDSPNLYAGC